MRFQIFFLIEPFFFERGLKKDSFGTLKANTASN